MAKQAIRASFQVLGVDDLIKSLTEFKRSVQKRVIYTAVRKCGPIVTRNIKPLVPRETGLLKKSIGHKPYMHRGGTGAGVVIGPRKGYKRQVVVRTTGKLRGRFRSLRKNEQATDRTQRRNPTQYSHLVEFGTRHSRKSLFLTRGWQKSRSQMSATLRRELQAGIAKAAKTAAARNRRGKR